MDTVRYNLELGDLGGAFGAFLGKGDKMNTELLAFVKQHKIPLSTLESHLRFLNAWKESVQPGIITQLEEVIASIKAQEGSEEQSN